MTATESTATGAEAASTAGGGGLSADRRQEFEKEVAELKVRTSVNQTDARNAKGGLALAIIGVVLCLVGFIGSRGSADGLAQNDFIVLSLGGVALTVFGSIIWLRFSLGQLLRLWLVRLVYEQRDAADRIIGK
jgi:hypothetical protein